MLLGIDPVLGPDLLANLRAMGLEMKLLLSMEIILPRRMRNAS